jgi:hypothetical protein
MEWSEAAANVPKQTSGGFMKFDKEGTFKFRILSAPITGFEYWTVDKEPIRSKEYPKVISDKIKPGDKIKYFWAFVVWNFQAEEVQILELTQTTIIEPLQELISNPEWGDPTGYSISVTRKGMSFSDTEYSVVPSPAQPTPANVLKAYKDKPINLDALYSGGNPFEAADGPQSEE